MVSNTDDAASHEERVRHLIESARYADALDEIAIALHDHPQDVALRLLASAACERVGALPEAAHHLAVVASLEPEHLQCNQRLAVLLAELDDTHGAIRAWRRVVAATQGQDPDAVTRLAIALSRDGQHDEAIELLSQLWQQRAHDAASSSNLGLALLAAGRESEALAVLKQALALDPRSAEAHCGIGLNHQQHGRWQDAAAAFRATERLAPDSAVGSFNLGLALLQLGDREGARRALLRAAALEPRDDEIQRALEPLLVRRPSSAALPSSRDGGASIHGDLESFDLINVLEFLRMQEKTGSLVISAPQGVGMLRLERGMLIGGSAPGLERLGEILVRRGLLSREKLQAALSRRRELYPGMDQAVEQDATTLGAVLLRERSLDEQQLTDVLFQMIVHVIGQINQWREGAFAFHPSEEGGFPIRFNVQNVVLDLLRVEDEKQHLEESSR
jgi:tetratricopeptide (TPR) repeat protein